jgi:hypothetical protein
MSLKECGDMRIIQTWQDVEQIGRTSCPVTSFKVKECWSHSLLRVYTNFSMDKKRNWGPGLYFIWPLTRETWLQAQTSPYGGLWCANALRHVFLDVTRFSHNYHSAIASYSFIHLPMPLQSNQLPALLNKSKVKFDLKQQSFNLCLSRLVFCLWQLVALVQHGKSSVWKFRNQQVYNHCLVLKEHTQLKTKAKFVCISDDIISSVI